MQQTAQVMHCFALLDFTVGLTYHSYQQIQQGQTEHDVHYVDGDEPTIVVFLAVRFDIWTITIHQYDSLVKRVVESRYLASNNYSVARRKAVRQSPFEGETQDRHS